MAIKLNTKNFNVLNQLIKSHILTRYEMKQLETVASYLISVKEPETATWIREHKIEYQRGLLEGFEIDNSQEAQLRDIQT